MIDLLLRVAVKNIKNTTFHTAYLEIIPCIDIFMQTLQ